MSTVVLEGSSSVVPTELSYEYILSAKEESVLVEGTNNTYINTPTIEYVLVEKDSSTLILAGGLGPQGLPGIPEEDIMYSKRIDFISDSLLYKAEAAVGSSENVAVWRIRKIILNNDGDVTELWASGTSSFDKVWSDKLTYSYS